MSSTVAVSGRLTVLEIAPGQERLGGRHHPHVAHRLDGPLAHRAVEDVVVLGLQAGRVDDVAVLGDVLDDRLDLLLLVAQRRSARGTVWLTICIEPPPTSFLNFTSAKVGLDAGGVAVHHQADGAGGREHRGLRVAPAVLLAELVALGPLLGGDREDLAVDVVHRPGRVVGRGVLAHHPGCAPRRCGRSRRTGRRRRPARPSAGRRCRSSATVIAPASARPPSES